MTLAYPKPERFVDERGLRAYRARNPRCEMLDCKRPSGPTPHHIKLRSAGRDDREHNLCCLCGWCHSELHQRGSREFFRLRGDQMTSEMRAKFEAVLGTECT